MCTCADMCICAHVHAGMSMWVGGWGCFGGADGCILLTMFVDVCQCCCLCLYAYCFQDTFLAVKLGE